MGCRNPWRLSIDRATGFVYWGEVGPDAGGDGPRGPRGYDEINAFEAQQVAAGTTLGKLFVHVTQDEQDQRHKADRGQQCADDVPIKDAHSAKLYRISAPLTGPETIP